MNKLKLLTLFPVFLASVLLVCGQKLPSEQTQKNCGQLTPTSSIRPTGDSPCSDARFFSDLDFAAKQNTPASIKLNIDRFIGNPVALKENGFLEPIAKLKVVMKGDSRGQFSEVKFNGTSLKPFFPASDWKLHEFDIPIELINFAEEPLADAMLRQELPVRPINEVAISVLAGSLDGDWVSLEIKVARPILLIHGILSGPEAWAKWTNKGGFLERTGLPFDTIEVGQVDTIESNAAKITQRVEALKQLWKVDSVTLVGHSKGGLDARLSAENSKSVSQVIMIGTPNAGSPVADILSEFLSSHWFRKYAAKFFAPGLEQLSYKNMTEFNKNHGATSNVEYVAIAGDFVPNCKPDETKPHKNCEMNLALASIVGKGDLVVSLNSVYSLSYAKNLPPITSKSDVGCQYLDLLAEEGENCQAVHINLLNSENLFLHLKPFIGKPVSD